ncbi:MAG TPA: hypothetical protein VL132_21255 [Planctomycetaceae bacterium]|nr:hypothetical protein [Planctomycetaceae bacterium]
MIWFVGDAAMRQAGACPTAADEDVHRTYRDRLRRVGFLTAVPPESVWR